MVPSTRSTCHWPPSFVKKAAPVMQPIQTPSSTGSTAFTRPSGIWGAEKVRTFSPLFV